jgi:predicted metal-dependent hydrolase
MNYTLKRSNRKTLALQILDGQLIVRAPINMPQSTIDAFINKKDAWIKKRLNSYIPIGIDLKKSEVYIFGELVNINLYTSKTFSVVLNDSLNIYMKAHSDLAQVALQVEDSLKKILMAKLEVMVKEVASLMQIKTPPFKVRRYKRIYGRCSSQGELAFNTYLFHERPEFIYAVVVHECAHLLEFNHSQNFYAIVESLLPNYRTLIRLNTCGYNLRLDQ